MRAQRANATRENEGLLYHDFRDLCNSSEVDKIYCDGLKFTLCIVPEWCSSKQLTYRVLDAQTDHKMANVLQNMLLNPGPGTGMHTKQQIFFLGESNLVLWHNYHIPQNPPGILHLGAVYRGRSHEALGRVESNKPL